MFSYFQLMTEADLDWVLKTEKQCYSFPWSKSGFIKVLDDGLAYLFFDNEQNKIGYACYLSVLDEIHLLNIAIHPNFQNQGVAKQVLLKMKDHFKELSFNCMMLEVRKTNPAIKLYKKLGFQQDGIRKNYYPLTNKQKEDAVLMSRKL
jgi:ribosomal-protein-alanine N-acetyltransferase